MIDLKTCRRISNELNQVIRSKRESETNLVKNNNKAK